MISELDTVVLTHDIKESGLEKGDLGSVVHRYQDGNSFEVEFVTGEGKKVAVLTLLANDIRSIRAQEILHVRELHTA